MATPVDFRIPDYLLQRLADLGVAHVFGVPGDFIMPFYRRFETSGVDAVGCCNELNAGYAADGYARVQGVGAAIVTGGVGVLSIINAVAGAYAEDVPVIVIAGGPATALYESQPKVHHTIPGNFRAPSNMMAEVTASAIVLDDAATATARIDEAITACLAYRKPVYIEIPINIQTAACARPSPLPEPSIGRTERPENVSSLVSSIAAKVTQGQRTVVCIGHEVERFGLQSQTGALIDKTGLPVASMMFGKAGYVETLHSCIGLYMGGMSTEDVRSYVEESDVVIFLGAHETDMNMGVGTSNLGPDQTVFVREGEAVVNGDVLPGVSLAHFIAEFTRQLDPVAGHRFPDQPRKSFVYSPTIPFEVATDAPLTSTRFYQRLAHFLQPGDVIAADTSAGINSAGIQLLEGNVSITTPYWASMGMCLGAAVGATFAPGLSNRVIAIEGDGSLLVGIQEVSTLVRYGKSMILFVLNNRGYGVERMMHDGEFNNVPHWRYSKLAEAVPGVSSREARTEGELEKALRDADSHSEDGPLVIEVFLDPHDTSVVFEALGRALSP